MVEKSGYSAELVTAARSVLIEVAHIQLESREARQIQAREAFEIVTALLDRLGIESWRGL